MGVVVKRARFFLTCQGKYYGGKDIVAETIRGQVLLQENIREKMTLTGEENQMSMFKSEKDLRIETGGGIWPAISTMPALKVF
ncbi:MAG: hypothetical protein JJE49_00575, partial [Peptostreptococcaceae bacterium]|nr:hypothetical protein [Peptostreptococcaceae bacterium]